MNVPSGESFKAAYPPFPPTIPFLIAWRTFCAAKASLTSCPMIIYLKTLHLEPIAFPPCKQFTIKSTELFGFVYAVSATISYKGLERTWDRILGKI